MLNVFTFQVSTYGLIFFYSKPETRIFKTNSTANDAPATFLFFFFVQKLNS